MWYRPLYLNSHSSGGGLVEYLDIDATQARNICLSNYYDKPAKNITPKNVIDRLNKLKEDQIAMEQKQRLLKKEYLNKGTSNARILINILNKIENKKKFVDLCSVLVESEEGKKAGWKIKSGYLYGPTPSYKGMLGTRALALYLNIPIDALKRFPTLGPPGVFVSLLEDLLN